MGRESSSENFKYYSKKYLMFKLGTVALWKLRDLLDEEDNKAAIAAYLFYNKPEVLEKYMYKDLINAVKEYEIKHKKPKNIYNDLFNYLFDISFKSQITNKKKLELINEINIIIKMYKINMMYICKKIDFNYQVFYRVVIKKEIHKISLNKIQDLVAKIEKEIFL